MNLTTNTERWLTATLVLLCLAALGLIAVKGGGAPMGATFGAWSGDTPALFLRDGHGQTHALSDFRGRVVLVHFWATWCEPCRDELPGLAALAQRYAPQGLSLVAVDVGESRAAIVRFTEQVPIAGLVLEDRNSEVFKAWQAQVLPASYLVGRDGKVRYWHLGELNWSDARTLQHIETLLGVPAHSGQTDGRQ